ncbi:protein of unknown function [Methylacidimicrobium sp. AP8]|uniref:hypothetical protein n=1 Tax=Methylacidimicrobium sp. AP8 TaxID=2730359 RepID=UPI0018C062B9|nr:hypothetical protein [Methylacidimicrobium sp. AP8]CAB4244382.1 protein of unknown function [Methylacidimicrobium sp. AP8]
MKKLLSVLLSVGGGLLFLGALGLIAIAERSFSSIADIPAQGHEPGDAAAWALVGIALIPIGSLLFFVWSLYRRSQKPPPAYAEFLEGAGWEDCGSRVRTPHRGTGGALRW